jgi:hypothetical protein
MPDYPHCRNPYGQVPQHWGIDHRHQMNRDQKCRRPVVVFFMFVLLCLSGVCAEAQEVPPPVAPPVPQIAQQSLDWCWLAVSEMIIRYKDWGISPKQCEILEVGYFLSPGTCCQAPWMCDRPGSLDEVQRIIAYYSRAFSRLAPPTDPMRLYRLLSRGHVVIAQLQNTNNPICHLVILRGMRFALITSATPSGLVLTAVPMVLVNDPGSYLISKMPYQMLLYYWRASIIVF